MTAGWRLSRGLYAITPGDSMTFEEILRTTAAVVPAGISALQYRDKRASRAERVVRASALGQLCRDAAVPFIVNDDPVLAADVGADGVHLGADDPSPELARRVLGDGAIIGISCYNDVERAVRLASGAADYVAFGAFFPTTSKMPRAHATPETLRAARPRLSVPVVAIGGITPENGAALVEAGADLLAVISGLYHVADPLSQVRRFQQLFSQRSESLP